VTRGSISYEHKVDQNNCKLVANNNIYVGPMNEHVFCWIFFPSMNGYYLYLMSFALNVVYNLSNATKRNIVANVVWD